MLRLVTKLVSTALVPLVLVGIASAAVVVPYKERSAGALTDVVPGHLSFAAEGRATYLGLYTMEGSNDFDLAGNVLNGAITLTSRDGSTISGSFAGTYAPLETGQVRFEVIVTWLAGTGRLEGVTGDAAVVAVVDGVAPGAAFRAQGFGNLVLP